MAKSKMRNVLLVLAFVFAAALCGAALLWQSPARASAEGDVPAVTGQAESVEGAVTLSDFAMKTGAEVRKSGIVGLRFTTNVSAADLALLPDNAVFGTLLLPETYLDGELTVFDTIDRVAKGDIRLKIRDILGAFMFGGEASDKKVKVLSGGERSRLAMIKLLLEPVNFLILDEPTNHLDMRSKDVLKEAIREFDGTVIVPGRTGNQGLRIRRRCGEGTHWRNL